MERIPIPCFMYRASDGTTFKTESECMRYERRCTLSKIFLIRPSRSGDIYGVFSDELKMLEHLQIDYPSLDKEDMYDKYNIEVHYIDERITNE